MCFFFAKTLVFVLLLLVIFSPGISAHEVLCASPERDLSRAKLLLSDGRYWESEAKFCELLDYDENGDAHLGLLFSIDGQNRKGLLDDTESIAKTICWRYPNRTESMAAGGYLAYRAGCISKSIRKSAKYYFAAVDFSRLAIKKKPKLLFSRMTLFLAETGLLEYQSAIEHFDDAVELAKQLSDKKFANARQQLEFEKQLKHHCGVAKIAIYYRDLNLVEKRYKKILRLLEVSQLYYPDLNEEQ